MGVLVSFSVENALVRFVVVRTATNRGIRRIKPPKILIDLGRPICMTYPGDFDSQSVSNLVASNLVAKAWKIPENIGYP
jgi:hypothetical protein